MRTTLLTLLCLAAASPARALDIKLWPLVDYQRTASARRLDLLGPLFTYAASDATTEVTLRPLLSVKRGPRVSHNHFSVLYPLFVSRWQPGQTEYRLLGLISYTSESEPHPDQWEQRFTIFPLFFYRHGAARGTSLSVLPFYADVQDFFGFERVQTVLFPLYLHLHEPLGHRTWMLFPFVSWSGGVRDRGWRVWPFYGWDQSGETERFTYVMWPLYISRERHFTRPEREHHLVSFPFYFSIDAPAKRTRAYGFFTHTIDRAASRETWGFPWPFWLSQRDLTSGERTALRLAPFYQDTHFGDLHAQFVMWPLLRWSEQEVADAHGELSYHHTRRDALLLLYRDIEQVQPARRRRRHLHTLFPLFRVAAENERRETSAVALLDALFPRNPSIRRVYAPLWQVYTRDEDGMQPARWSLLWDLVSSDGARIRYPVHLDVAE